MYDIYIGKPAINIYEWLYSFTEEEYNELLVFIDKINYNELEYINKINGNIKIAQAMKEACNKAL